MSADARDRATTHQAGKDQHIITNNYFGPPPDGPQPDEEPGGGGWFSGHRGTWITAGATVAVALIGVLGTSLLNGDGGGDSKAGGSPSATAPASGGVPSPTTEPPTDSSPTGMSAAARADPDVQWEGMLLLDDSPGGRKDLDPQQPVSYDNSFDQKNDFYGYFGEIRAPYGAKASLWTGTDLPDYAKCASTVDAAGADSQPVRAGTVLCVRTNEGRVGRLKVTRAAEDSTSIQFDGVVWSPAASPTSG